MDKKISAKWIPVGELAPRKGGLVGQALQEIYRARQQAKKHRGEALEISVPGKNAAFVRYEVLKALKQQKITKVRVSTKGFNRIVVVFE